MSSLGTSWTLVSRHRGQAWAGLIVAIGVEHELAEQRAFGVDDSDVGIGDEEADLLPGVRPAQNIASESAGGCLAGWLTLPPRGRPTKTAPSSGPSLSGETVSPKHPATIWRAAVRTAVQRRP
jgi:hypothetical protein